MRDQSCWIATRLRVVFDPSGLAFCTDPVTNASKMRITQSQLPKDMIAARRLPGIQPVEGPWLRFDDAYSGQMRLRRDLLASQRADVLAQPDHAIEPANELLDHVLDLLPPDKFEIRETDVICADEITVDLDRNDPLGTLGALVQCDFCLHQKRDAAHVLEAAVLCFPASWTLSEKIGKPLQRVHDPVEEYDARLAQRVQRLFDGVQVGRPIWRFNQLWYDDPALFAPRTENDPRESLGSPQPESVFRAERQTLLRLPLCRWVVFAIHTVLVPYDAVPDALRIMPDP